MESTGSEVPPPDSDAPSLRPHAALLDSEVGPAKRRGRSFRAQIVIAFVIFPPFAALSFAASQNGSAGDVASRNIPLITAATITGPFVGAIARGSQGCCLRASIDIAVFCVPILLGAVAFQFVPLPFRRGAEAIRLTVWALAWFIWFAGGILSFLHAFS